MAIIQISKMQQRSGNLVDLPQLDEAELGFASDAKRLFIGKETPSENIEVLTSYSEIAFDQIAGSQGNLDISANVANGQALVFDGTNWVNRGGDAGGLITLGDVANVKITGGAIGYVLETDGIGNLSWTPKSTIIAYIQNITQADPAVVTTTEDNFFTNGAEVTITDVPGMTELNGNTYYVDVLTSNTFALYTSSNLNPLFGVDSTGYNAFPYTSVTATASGTNEITVGDSSAFNQDDPVVFVGDTANSLIVSGETYYVANVVNGTTLTISEAQGGSEKTLATDTLNANVYVPGGRVISLVGGAGGAAAGGSSETVQYNKTGILTGDASFIYNDTAKLLTLNGTANVSNLNVGNLNTTSTITAPQFISTIGTGTAPFVVSSTTLVSNLAAATAIIATSANSAQTANVAQTVSNAAQPNITSVGTLTGLVMSNTSGINGMYIQGGSNTGAHVSYLVNNRGGDNGINFAIYGNNYASGSYFSVGADGIAITGNTSGQMAFGTVSANATILGANNNAVLKLHANGQAEVSSPLSPSIALQVNGNLGTTSITTGANTTAGTITGNWTLTTGSKLQATYADLAEYYLADEYYIPGTVVEFGGDKEVTLATEGSRRVAGVVSTNPAYVMNSTCDGEYPVILALQGRVPCKVKGNISKGDMLVSAGGGYAKAEANPAVGTVIGKAIQDFKGTEGRIEVAVGRL